MCRYLKNCIWKLEKKRELEERKLVQALYSDLVDMVKLYNVSKRVSMLWKLVNQIFQGNGPLNTVSYQFNITHYFQFFLSNNDV